MILQNTPSSPIADSSPAGASFGVRLETATDPILPPTDTHAWRSGLLAFVVHGLLVAMLFLGVQWTTHPPVAMQAELWSSIPAVQMPQPKPRPAPDDVAAPEPTKQIKPDIALRPEKKKKTKPVETEAPKKEPIKKEPKKEAKQQAEKTLAKHDDTLDNLRKDELKRALAAAGGAGGKDPVSAAGVKGDPAYQDKIIARIRSNLAFPQIVELKNNPRAEFRVTLLPTGEIIAVKKSRSSGVSAWDDAVEKAIWKSSPMPKDKNGFMNTSIEAGFTPEDLL
jgi:colicin import membrane protein